MKCVTVFSVDFLGTGDCIFERSVIGSGRVSDGV